MVKRKITVAEAERCAYDMDILQATCLLMEVRQDLLTLQCKENATTFLVLHTAETPSKAGDRRIPGGQRRPNLQLPSDSAGFPTGGRAYEQPSLGAQPYQD